jgi:peptidoglycan biosynthesis protein MviN/MurJ (putative lipid II flippase)
MRSIGYFDVCSFLIDLFFVVLTFISKYPYKTWGIIQILRTIAMLLLISTPRLVWYFLFHRSNYHPGKSKQCAFVRGITMCIQLLLYVLWIIQAIAEKTEQADFGNKALTVIITIIVVVVVMVMNVYLLFLYIYYGRNGMELHKKYLEEQQRKRMI